MRVKQVAGVEPVSQRWQRRILTIEIHLHVGQRSACSVSPVFNFYFGLMPMTGAGLEPDISTLKGWCHRRLDQPAILLTFNMREISFLSILCIGI